MPRSVTAIQEDLDAAYSARRIAMTAQSYSVDSGQGRQQVQRADLQSINKTIQYLESELEGAQEFESGGNGITAGSFERY